MKQFDFNMSFVAWAILSAIPIACVLWFEGEILVIYLDAQIGRIQHRLPAVICGTIVNICSRYLIVPVYHQGFWNKKDSSRKTEGE